MPADVSIATLHELRAEAPEIFGPGGGSSRIFSLTEVAVAIGFVVGPLGCGSLADTVGFYYTACALGERLEFTSMFLSPTNACHNSHSVGWCGVLVILLLHAQVLCAQAGGR